MCEIEHHRSAYAMCSELTGGCAWDACMCVDVCMCLQVSHTCVGCVCVSLYACVLTFAAHAFDVNVCWCAACVFTRASIRAENVCMIRAENVCMK